MVKLTINGKKYDLDVNPQMPLLWAIRDIAKLTGTKFGCGKGLCGACTVHLDGKPTRSCITPVNAALKSKITTIEGLSKHNDHPLQLAWHEHNVPQCGYCQSGQLMTAAGLLSEHQSPTDEQINQAMSGNLCRCGTYPRIKAAIKTAAKHANQIEIKQDLSPVIAER
ncbi:(2Fe-2S)-binding protein [Flocculibacter collagenilyticus]|uniref:(2Fe-2S)-binding protein n=1 Tax=Flocculibacter collagenilyticus TaxID=2744479 RepID=UPI0018F75E2E|nr:(2Fe-2S)-binding protein [Flocculibacter collagenilyticus]